MGLEQVRCEDLQQSVYGESLGGDGRLYLRRDVYGAEDRGDGIVDHYDNFNLGIIDTLTQIFALVLVPQMKGL